MQLLASLPGPSPPCTFGPPPPLTHHHLPRRQESLFEEASLLRDRELELKSKLSGHPEDAPVVPVVTVEHIEQVCGCVLWWVDEWVCWGVLNQEWLGCGLGLALTLYICFWCVSVCAPGALLPC